MNIAEVLIGLVSLTLAALTLWVALPGSDGKARSWLGNDTRQSIYVVAILTLSAFGVSQVITGLVP
jgi:hypothetical protein